MEKTRTLYKLRKFKNSITLAVSTLLFGVFIFAGINIFNNQLTSFLREKSTNVLQERYQDNINNALSASNKSIELLEKSSIIAVLFSLEALIMMFFYVRMSGKTSKFSKSAPSILSLGVILVSIYYLIVGFLLPSQGQINALQSRYNVLNIVGACLIFIANLIFVYQIFIQVVLERVED